MAKVSGFRPLVSVVDFNHARYEEGTARHGLRLTLELYRGPEVEKWLGLSDRYNPPSNNDWSLLPFLALPDGSHAYVWL